ncbi:MAG: AAA family ATPase, partial [Acidobacteria bacterium]|nr:AAA family ATPase [Acidobacteriota bacterium]
MIRYLSIRNLAVIESVSVEFEHAFNVLTGETGAGKSILVEAVGLLLGGRASQVLVRTGEEIATVEAIFESRAGTEIVVRREITSHGRSRAFIDGHAATAAALSEVTGALVELHGQHEHQQFLDPEQHLPLLDEWAGLAEERSAVALTFAALCAVRERLDRRRMDSYERAARLDLIDFQLSELDKVAPQVGEDDALGDLRGVLRNADRVERLCREGYAELYDSETSVLTGLDHVWKRVTELASIDSRFRLHLDSRDDLKAQLEDLAFALRDAGLAIDTSPARLQEVEDRLAALERLKRKYGPTLADVIGRWDALRAQRQELTAGEESAQELERLVAEHSTAFLEGA